MIHHPEPKLEKVTMSKMNTNTQKQNQELESIKQMIEDKKVDEFKLKLRRRIQNPVVKVSKALHQYKTERKRAEEDLIRTINKVNLDKMILSKEKQKILWNHSKNEQSYCQDQLKKQCAKRFI